MYKVLLVFHAMLLSHDDVPVFINVFEYGATLRNLLRLEDIPRLIFQILAQLATLNASVSPVAWPSRISFAELHGYAQRRCLGLFQVTSEKGQGKTLQILKKT